MSNNEIAIEFPVIRYLEDVNVFLQQYGILMKAIDDGFEKGAETVKVKLDLNFPYRIFPDESTLREAISKYIMFHLDKLHEKYDIHLHGLIDTNSVVKDEMADIFNSITQWNEVLNAMMEDDDDDEYVHADPENLDDDDDDEEQEKIPPVVVTKHGGSRVSFQNQRYDNNESDISTKRKFDIYKNENGFHPPPTEECNNNNNNNNAIKDLLTVYKKD